MDGIPDPRPATETPRAIDVLLAGLQAGILATLWMLVWMGLSAAWQRRSFWSPENLMANVLHPSGAIAGDFQWSTVSGLAVYLAIYGALGAVFAFLTIRHTARQARITFLAMIFALAWYYFSFHLLWKTIAPAITFLHPERATAIGHVVYGLVLGRFAAYLPHPKKIGDLVVETNITAAPLPDGRAVNGSSGDIQS
jgi:hypothetical protein